MSLLSHADCASMSTTTTTTTRDRGDRYGPIEWAQLSTGSNSHSFAMIKVKVGMEKPTAGQFSIFLATHHKYDPILNLSFHIQSHTLIGKCGIQE